MAVKRRIVIALVVTGVAGIALAGLWANNMPPFQHAKTEVSSTFDRTATEGVISVNNAIQVMPDNYAKIAPGILDN
jgi:hypothetical protein